MSPTNDRSPSADATTTTILDGAFNGTDPSIDMVNSKLIVDDSKQVKINGSSSGHADGGLSTWRRGSIECRHVKLPLLEAQHRDNCGDDEGDSVQTGQLFVEPAPADEIL